MFPKNLIQRHLLPERIQDKRTQLDASYTVARQKIAKQTIPITETKQETSSPMVSGAGHQQHKISWNKDLRAALYRIYELEFSIARLEDQLA